MRMTRSIGLCVALAGASLTVQIPSANAYIGSDPPPSQTITVTVNDVIQLTNDPAYMAQMGFGDNQCAEQYPVPSQCVAVNPYHSAAPLVAENQTWDGWYSTTATYKPVFSATIDPALPDGQELKIYYALMFGDTGATVMQCSVTGLGGTCDPGPAIVTASAGTFAYPSLLEAIVMIPDVNGQLQSMYELGQTGDGISGVTVFLPPSCGGTNNPPCPKTKMAVARRTLTQRGTSTGGSKGASKSVSYYWRQVFDGSDLFIVKHRTRTILKKEVLGDAGVTHSKTWRCPDHGRYVLVVKGSNPGGQWRSEHKKVVRC